MDIGDINLRLQKVFRENFDDENLEIKDEMSSDDIEDWDSLSHISLIVSTEDEFNIKFTPKEIEELENIGDFKNLILNKVNNIL